MTSVYVVVLDEDPGYAAERILGVFTTRQAAERRAAGPPSYHDVFVFEVPLDEAVDVVVST